MMKMLMIAGIVGFVVVTEVALAFMLIPSTKDVQAWAETHDTSKEEDAHGEKKADDGHGAAEKKDDHDAHGAKDSHGAAAKGHGEKKAAHGGGHGAKPAAKGGHGASGGHGGGHGAPAGPVHPGGGGTGESEMDMGKYNIMVHHPAQNLTLRVNFHLIGMVTEGEEEDASTMFKVCEHRLRDQVIYEVRNSTPADLTDPGLGLIKRKILAKTNELLGQPVLLNIVFSDFTYLEQ